MNVNEKIIKRSRINGISCHLDMYTVTILYINYKCNEKNYYCKQ